MRYRIGPAMNNAAVDNSTTQVSGSKGRYRMLVDDLLIDDLLVDGIVPDGAYCQIRQEEALFTAALRRAFRRRLTLAYYVHAMQITRSAWHFCDTRLTTTRCSSVRAITRILALTEKFLVRHHRLVGMRGFHV